MSEFQLDMTLNNSGNPLKDALDNGKFVFLVETAPPENARNREEAVERLMPLAEMMSRQNDFFGGLAITDMPDSPWSAIDIGAALPENLRRSNLYCLSGNGRDENAIARELQCAIQSGVDNILCLSGNASPLSVRECRGRNFCSSISQLEIAGRMEKNLFAGTQFNPFHYERNTVFALYNNLAEKLNAGTQFIVSQSGWDMLQNQTLAWYLLNRKCYIPMIAHLTLLSPDRVEKIIAGKVPGVTMTPAFRKLLERELSGSKAQFEAAQYRRIELQCAGCRLMGYSGVQISGVDYPGKAQIIAQRIRSALQEFRSFEHWLDEYNSHQAGAEMGSGTDRYHLYDRMLHRGYDFENPPLIKNPGVVDFSWQEKFLQNVKKILFAQADKQRPGRDILLKKFLAGCSGCEKCILPQNNFVCIRNCPKRLSAGPCGAIKEDGSCEICSSECVFVRKVRCSRYFEGFSCLES